MLSIQKSSSHQGKCIPNILPCRINHSGPVDASKRYWNPVSKDDKTISYFRGRKLHAKRLKVPKGYRGVVLAKTDRILPPRKMLEDEEEEGDREMPAEVKVLEEQSAFQEVLVWGHEAVMDEGDPYVRGVEEWIGFAESIHGFTTNEDESDKEGKKA